MRSIARVGACCAVAGALLGPAPRAAADHAVHAYLPLQLTPELAHQVEALLLLADRPVLSRPIRLAEVREALPAACQLDARLCAEVAAQLEPYLRRSGAPLLRIETAAASGPEQALANAYGLTTQSAWQVGGSAHLQLHERVRVTLAGVAYQGEFVPTGSMLSLSAFNTQLDLGYRDHWWSPLTDSSMLIGTQAPTMPSATLSNQAPLTRLRLRYELFGARMSSSERIRFEDSFIRGHPSLIGLHVASEPVRGWGVGVSRLLQYGGGERGGDSLFDALRAFVQPSRYDNIGPGLERDDEFGNQAAAVTSRVLFPGTTPFAVYFEYAGEDTSRSRNYLLGNTALSTGIHFPSLAGRYDLRYEVSEWQNGWYVHGTYRDGLTNRGRVLGHWGGDARRYGDGVGAQSHMLRLAWPGGAGGLVDLRYRTLANQGYSAPQYRRAHEATLRYSRPWQQLQVGGELLGGRDVFGDGFVRVAVYAQFAHRASQGSLSGSSMNIPEQRSNAVEAFVDAGITGQRTRIDLADAGARETQPRAFSPHIGIGARRAVTQALDVGMRLELDDIDGNLLLSIRAIDLRYRLNGPLALTAFGGAARYDLATPAYGFYAGVGVQWRNVAPGWDVGLEARYAIKVARDSLLPEDAAPLERNDNFYDIVAATLSLSRRF